MALCRSFDERLKTRVLNAEEMSEVEDGSYDLVLVQDGLHHLPRPTLGFTEMLRVARIAAIVIEPHSGTRCEGDREDVGSGGGCGKLCVPLESEHP